MVLRGQDCVVLGASPGQFHPQWGRSGVTGSCHVASVTVPVPVPVPVSGVTAVSWQISDIQVTGQSEDMTAKEKLLLWSQRMVEDYQGLRCDNFTTSWRDGRLFNAIIHRHRWVPR